MKQPSAQIWIFKIARPIIVDNYIIFASGSAKQIYNHILNTMAPSILQKTYLIEAVKQR